MRITITLMIIAMVLILVAGLVSVRILIPSGMAEGRDVVLVVINGCSEPGLDRHLLKGDHPILKEMRRDGIAFDECAAPSPWYPAAAASLMTGLNPAEHGLTAAHAHLSLRAETLTETFFDRGYWTCAFVERHTLLACTGVLQGFQRVIQNSGPDLVDRALSYVGKHIGERPLLALLEVDAGSCGGEKGVCAQVEWIVRRLEKDRFFHEGGALVVCAPGGPLPENEEAFARAALREFVAIRCDDLKGAPQGPVLKPTSLANLFAIVTRIAWEGTFREDDLLHESRCVVTEMALRLSDPCDSRKHSDLPRFSRIVRFDDSPFRCFVDAADEIVFQDDECQPARVDAVRESLTRKKIEYYLQGLDEVEDINVSRAAGLKLSADLAARLGAEWSGEELRLRPLHAVEHFRMAVAFEKAGFDALAISEYRTALAIDREFSLALFRIAEACAALDRQSAVPYFQAYLRRFGDQPGEESLAQKAREFLGAESAASATH